MDEEAHKRILGNYEWIKRFNVREYVGNAPLIEKLYEEKQMVLAQNVRLKQENGELTSRLHNQEINNTDLTTRIEEANKRSTAVFFVSLVAAVMAGLGGNFAASQPTSPVGWVLIVLAIVLEI